MIIYSAKLYELWFNETIKDSAPASPVSSTLNLVLVDYTFCKFVYKFYILYKFSFRLQKCASNEVDNGQIHK